MFKNSVNLLSAMLCTGVLGVYYMSDMPSISFSSGFLVISRETTLSIISVCFCLAFCAVEYSTPANSKAYNLDSIITRIFLISILCFATWNQYSLWADWKLRLDTNLNLGSHAWITPSYETVYLQAMLAVAGQSLLAASLVLSNN